MAKKALAEDSVQVIEALDELRLDGMFWGIQVRCRDSDPDSTLPNEN